MNFIKKNYLSLSGFLLVLLDLVLTMVVFYGYNSSSVRNPILITILGVNFMYLIYSSYEFFRRKDRDLFTVSLLTSIATIIFLIYDIYGMYSIMTSYDFFYAYSMGVYIFTFIDAVMLFVDISNEHISYELSKTELGISIACIVVSLGLAISGIFNGYMLLYCAFGFLAYGYIFYLMIKKGNNSLLMYLMVSFIVLLVTQLAGGLLMLYSPYPIMTVNFFNPLLFIAYQAFFAGGTISYLVRCFKRPKEEIEELEE